MNLPNSQYFKWNSTYAGAPIKETEVQLKAISDKYKRSEELYNVFSTAIGSIKAPDDNSKAYLDNTKQHLDDLIKNVAKDAQGNVRYETAEQAIKKAALEFKNDRTIQHIMKTNKDLDDQDTILHKLQAEGKAPVGRGDLGVQQRAKFKAIDIDPVTKQVKFNSLQGWYEPHGDYSAAYSDLSASLGYDEKEKLSAIQNRMNAGEKISAEDKTTYDNGVKTMMDNSALKPEIDQDRAVLLDRFGGNQEKTNEFILNNRIKPSLSTKDPTQIKADLSAKTQEKTYNNALNMQEQKQINAENRDAVKQQNALNMEALKQQNALEMEATKAQNRIDLKTTVGGGTRKGAGNKSTATSGVSAEAEQIAMTMFEDVNEENNIETNPYTAGASTVMYDEATKKVVSSNYTKAKDVDAIVAATRVGGQGQGGFSAADVKRMKEDLTKSGDKDLDRFNDFASVVKRVRAKDGKMVEFSKLGKQQQIEVYQASLASDSEIFKETMGVKAVDGLNAGMKAYLKANHNGNNVQAFIKGGDEKDQKTLNVKLQESLKLDAKEVSALINGEGLQFKGFRMTGTPNGNESLLGGLVYNINSAKGGTEIIIPAPPAIKNIATVYNIAVKSAVKQKMSDTQNNRVTAGYVNAGGLIYPGVYLEPHKEYDNETGTQIVKFKPVMKDATDSKYQMLSSAFKEIYKETTGHDIEEYLSLSDLKNLALAKIQATGFFQDKAKSAKNVAEIPTTNP